jgi:hypothetical protein
MTTQSRIDANRANALHSTGPRSEAGKAVSSQNATTHGLFTASFALAPEDQSDFDLLLQLQRDELQPQGINEELIFANLVQAAWKTDLVRRLEAKALAEQDEAILDRYSRYNARFERAYFRVLAELRKLQTERALRQAASQPAEDTPPLADAKVKKQTEPSPAAHDPFLDQIQAEARWTMAQLRAIRMGIPPPPPAGFPFARVPQK